VPDGNGFKIENLNVIQGNLPGWQAVWDRYSEHGHLSGDIREELAQQLALQEAREAERRSLLDSVQLSEDAQEAGLRTFRDRSEQIGKPLDRGTFHFIPFVKPGNLVKRGTPIGIISGAKYIVDGSTGRPHPLGQNGLVTAPRDGWLTYVAGRGAIEPGRPIIGDMSEGGASTFFIPRQ